jgi:ankyrin repeat protein
MRVGLNVFVGWFVVSLTAAPLLAESDERLIDAVKAGKVDVVRTLLKQRADVNAAEGDGSTVLHWAVHRDNAVAVDLLLRAGARPNVSNDLGATPLYLACTNRNAALVKTLLAAGANPNAALLQGETVLMECARAGTADGVKALIAKGADVNARESTHGQTALMWAASQKHSSVVEVLLELGADLRARSRVYTQFVKNADRTANREPVTTVQRGGSTPLHFAARSGDVASVRLLLKAGADANDPMPDQMSPLILAAQSGHGDVAALLLKSGAEPNSDAVGYTALHAAILRGDLQLVNALLARGANPSVRIVKPTPIRRDSQDFILPTPVVGATPYLLAAKYLEVDIMRALAAAGADTKSTMPNGATALMMAAGALEARARDERRNLSRRGICVCDGAEIEDAGRAAAAVKAAIDAGIDVNAISKAGDTALHAAAAMGYVPVVQLLADNGANLNVKNKRGQTPLAGLVKGRGPSADDDGTDDTAARVAAAGSVVGAGSDVYGIQRAQQSTAALLRKLGAVE